MESDLKHGTKTNPMWKKVWAMVPAATCVCACVCWGGHVSVSVPETDHPQLRQDIEIIS